MVEGEDGGGLEGRGEVVVMGVALGVALVLRECVEGGVVVVIVLVDAAGVEEDMLCVGVREGGVDGEAGDDDEAVAVEAVVVVEVVDAEVVVVVLVVTVLVVDAEVVVVRFPNDAEAFQSLHGNSIKREKQYP